jgi:riboflavin-specific deaminase-like protein
MFIFSNLATSLDGKIATRSRVHFSLGTPTDRKMMLTLRRRADAVIVGASTLRAYRGPLLSGTGNPPINIVVSTWLDGISPSWKFFTDRRTRKIIFVSADAPKARIRKFARVAEIHLLKRPTAGNPVSVQIVRALEKLRVRKLLVEGGGGLMWDFIQPGLLNEINLTLTPRILGGADAPTLVDGRGFEPKDVANFKLKRSRKIGNELYLVYSKIAKRGP